MSAEVLLGGAIITLSGICIGYIVLNNATGLGFADDILLVPLLSWASEGTKLLT